MLELDHTPKYVALNHDQMAIICMHDCAKIVDYSWHAQWNEMNKSYYAMGRKLGGGRKTIGMARLILDTPDGMVADHIHHRTLDNRCTEIRNVTYEINNRNTKRAVAIFTTGKVFGVRRSGKNRWSAKIGSTLLGTYATKKEAINVRKRAEEERGWNDHMIVV